MAHKLPPLRFGYDALEPHIDAKTMELHHDNHHKAYVDNLNQPRADGAPKGAIADAIKRDFGSFEQFQSLLTDAATRTRRHGRFVLGGLILALLWTSSIGAQEPPILRFGGRVTYVSPQEMLVALDTGRVVMLDLARIPQGEIRQFAQSDYVIVSGFIRRPSHRIIATSIQRASPWVPTTPLWAP